MEPLPHFVQVGQTPVLVCDGAGELACACGQSVLVQGYRPERLIALAVRCASCGAITTTPDLPAAGQLLGYIIPVDRLGREMPDAGTLAPGVILADRATVERADAPLRPRPISPDPITLSPALLDEVAADYDRFSNSAFAAHIAAKDLRHTPLAWAWVQLRDWLSAPNSPLVGTVETTVAAAHIGAFHQFVAAWKHHSLFPQMAALAASSAFGVHELAVFASLSVLFGSGNRIGLMTPPDGPPRVREWSVQTADRLLALETAPFSRFDWPDGRPWTAAAIKTALQDAVAAARGRINLRKPGILVLSVGRVPETFEQPMQDGMERLFRAAGRANRGLAALGMITPRVVATDRRDRFGFGWLFRPVANPFFEGENRVVIGTPNDPRR